MRTQEFRFHPGPVFTQLLLADEINRSPAKTHAALLEIMQERRVTVDGTSHEIEPPFLVLATQNPIESEGTYNLPEAQLDRFMFKLVADYPAEAEEARILELHSRQVDINDRLESELETVTSPAEITRNHPWHQRHSRRSQAAWTTSTKSSVPPATGPSSIGALRLEPALR